VSVDVGVLSSFFADANGALIASENGDDNVVAQVVGNVVQRIADSEIMATTNSLQWICGKATIGDRKILSRHLLAICSGTDARP
jgi:hypothetical protein